MHLTIYYPLSKEFNSYKVNNFSSNFLKQKLIDLSDFNFFNLTRRNHRLMVISMNVCQRIFTKFISQYFKFLFFLMFGE